MTWQALFSHYVLNLVVANPEPGLPWMVEPTIRLFRDTPKNSKNIYSICRSALNFRNIWLNGKRPSLSQISTRVSLTWWKHGTCFSFLKCVCHTNVICKTALIKGSWTFMQGRSSSLIERHSVVGGKLSYISIIGKASGIDKFSSLPTFACCPI